MRGCLAIRNRGYLGVLARPRNSTRRRKTGPSEAKRGKFSTTRGAPRAGLKAESWRGESQPHARLNFEALAEHSGRTLSALPWRCGASNAKFEDLSPLSLSPLSPLSLSSPLSLVRNSKTCPHSPFSRRPVPTLPSLPCPHSPFEDLSRVLPSREKVPEGRMRGVITTTQTFASFSLDRT
jgi:hypothetical protein